MAEKNINEEAEAQARKEMGLVNHIIGFRPDGSNGEWIFIESPRWFAARELAYHLLGVGDVETLSETPKKIPETRWVIGFEGNPGTPDYTMTVAAVLDGVRQEAVPLRDVMPIASKKDVAKAPTSDVRKKKSRKKGKKK